MDKIIKLRLFFHDHLEIMVNLARIIADHNFNILSLETQRKKKHSVIFLELENTNKESRAAELLTALQSNSNCIETKVIKTLPREKKEKSYEVVLDSVIEGIISIDDEGCLTTINRVAKEIVGVDESQNMAGSNISELTLPDSDLKNTLKTKEIKRQTKNVMTEKGRIQFFSCCKPIKDADDHMVGAVEIMKYIKDIEDLANTVSQHSDIAFNDIIGKSAVIRETISLAQKIADTNSIVSIRGESGTGKEVFARAIAFDSCRCKSIIPINCAALPESLLESELFGYVGGAFTGANKRGKPGLFEVAKNGTIFLDEIGDIPLNVQAKVLRVIEEKRIRRIGGADEIAVNVRIITATNKNLEKMVEQKEFREDLYYRINVLPVHIPPLRQRREDIPLLIEHFLSRINLKLNKSVQHVDESALKKMLDYHWPGNVRELKNVIERAAILTSTDRITEGCVLFSFETEQKIEGKRPPFGEQIGAVSLTSMIKGYERSLIKEAIEKSLSLRKTAKILKVSHTTLLNKIKKYRLQVER
jgi:TyrR family helix-turn-helix protein/PAS domain S-box-containing protein